MKLPVTRIQARNFRSLAGVDLRLGPLNVLIGPNGSGKTNVLNVLRFLATTVRFDLAAALQEWNGFDHIQRQSARPGAVELIVEGLVTANSSENAPDRYRLRLARHGKSISRQEEFTFKRQGGRGRRITVSGDRVTIYEDEQETFSRSLASSQTTGLATLPKLSDSEGGLGIRSFTEFLSRILVFEPDVSAARQPAREYGATIAQDASNLADALNRIRMRDPDSWELLTQELALDELRRTVHAFEANDGRIAAVVVHRDADVNDPDGAVAADLARQLAALDGHPVVPVQAIEAWWFLFPEAVEAVRPRAWKDSLPRQPRDVELINQPKKALQQATRGRRAPEYAESDSPIIAAYIREKSLIPLCPCKSYDRMVTLARTIV